MNILICAQKVDKNDDILGFFHSWVAEFARQCEKVTVICLYKGVVDLPVNVKVLSLGKEGVMNNRQNKTCDNAEKSKLLRIVCYMLQKATYSFRFYKYIWQERRKYDAVFVHMNPIYVLLGGLFWRTWHKKIGLWYAHGHVPWELRVAEKCTDNIFTSTPSGCRLDSKKIRVVGQGIDVDNFPLKAGSSRTGKLKLLTVGRISPVKDLETLIRAVGLLREKGLDAELEIVGAIGLKEQEKYFRSLLALTKELSLEKRINFVGSVPYKNIVQHLAQADIFVSASRTGSLDKVFLEAILMGLPVVGCNEALLSILGDYTEKLFYPAGDQRILMERIEALFSLSNGERARMQGDLRNVVINDHGLKGFVKKILSAK